MSKPVNISSPRKSPTPLAGTPVSRSIADSLRAQYAGGAPPNIPPRSGTPRVGTPLSVGVSAPSSSSVGGISAARPATPAQRPATPAQGDSGSGSAPTPLGIDDLSDEAKAKVLRKHLVSKEEREGGATGTSTPASYEVGVAGPSGSGAASASFGNGARSTTPVPGVTREDSEAFPVPYNAPGADVLHDIYKWQQSQNRAGRRRSVSFAGSTSAAPDPAFEHIHEPGGFRRNYLLLQQNGGAEEERPMLNNFIDFLYIFGHFAGEDLEEIEEEDEEAQDDHEAGYGRTSGFATTATGDLHRVPGAGHEPSEESPLLGHSKSRSMSRSRRRQFSSTDHHAHGDATVGQAILMLLKSFVGTGVLFLGKAFFNGGLLFSTITIAAIALISLWSFLLLVKTKFIVSGSFGDIGGTLYGPWMRYIILTSIAVSQIGFVCAYTIFVAENLQALVMAVTNCARFIPTVYIILIQLVVFLPLALVRNLAKLSATVLIADAFILAGLIYVFGSEFSIIANRGIAEVAMFNPKDFPLLIGTAVFSFEGIGLVIPITDAMREPHKFPPVLSGVMIGLLFLFGGAGALSYLAFGSDIKTVVLVNLDSTSRLTQSVQLLYSLAILLSVPLQFFPAVRIMENGLFTRSGKHDHWVKWQKNGFRFLCVMGCTVISWVGASDLDKFVAFVGSFACVPLCFVYPAMLHYRACARTWREKAADIALGVFGLIAAVYTTVQTIRLMATPEPAQPPVFGCKSSLP